MSQTAEVAQQDDTALSWLVSRLTLTANRRIRRLIASRADAAVERLYQMHSVGSGLCHCGALVAGHAVVDDHAPVEVPMDKSRT